jgi:hypothetical protein
MVGSRAKAGGGGRGRAMVSGGMIQTAKCEVDGEEREGRKRTTWFSNSQMNIGGIYLSVTWLVKTKRMNLRYIS